MAELHMIRATDEKLNTIESFSSRFIPEQLIHAQKRSWEVLALFRQQIREGWTEVQANKKALDIFSDFGVHKHWHRPSVRFGSGTTLTIKDAVQTEYCLREGDPISIDFGPVWNDPLSNLAYEGDVGDTFVFGSNVDAERCIQVAHQLFTDAQERWKTQHLTGAQIYGFLENQALRLGYQFLNQVNGHRLGDFPHHQYSKERLASLQFQPKAGLWVLEVQIINPRLMIGAFFEDVLAE